MEVFRGDIFFVRKGGYSIGSEQESGRPAIIVSNDTGNRYSDAVEVVYLTTKEKPPLPTHVEVICKVPSTALCEQIFTVSKERLGEFIKECTKEEMVAIDKALMISVGVGVSPASTETVESAEVEELKMKLADNLEKIKQLEADNQKNSISLKDETKEMKLSIERDFYKEQYEKLLERMIGQKGE